MNRMFEQIISKAVAAFDTPFYLSAWQPIIEALTELKPVESSLPVKHWLSFKTHPIAPLIRNWLDLGLGIEVVSEYECLAALREGFLPSQILVNGVAKHRWLKRCQVRGLRVHFDSLHEIESLQTHAKEYEWRVGIRCHLSEEYDPDEPDFGGQFGLSPVEVHNAANLLNSSGLIVESLHFHLRTNIKSIDSYRIALKELSEICSSSKLFPRYIDCGGGLPIPRKNLKVCEERYDLHNIIELNDIFKDIPSLFPAATEIWMENGRFITARSAVLVVKVLDIKERKDSRYLICDGGRTNHALVSDWEAHEITMVPKRHGSKCATTVCGPTCMAFDRLLRADLPADISIGDCIIWMEAGAYHIPWETRFSHGLAKVIWCNENNQLSLAREEETFSQWWGQWRD